LVYNWHACTGNLEIGGTNDHVQTSLASNVNFVGNKYIAGPSSNTQECLLGSIWPLSMSKVYVQDNETPWCGGAACAATAWNLGWQDGVTERPPSEAAYRVSTPFPAPPITATPRGQLEAVLASQVGATKPKRDSLDTRLIGEFQSRTGKMGRRGAAMPILNGGTPPVDSDHDGMPDTWEKAHGLNANNRADGAAFAANGYTNLENYLNELAGDTAAPSSPPPRPAPANLRPRAVP
jgi:hypothetical protein